MKVGSNLKSLVALSIVALAPLSAFAATTPGTPPPLSGKCAVPDLKLVAKILTTKVQGIVAADTSLKPGSVRVKIILPKLDPAATVLDLSSLPLLVNPSPDASNPYKVSVVGNNSASHPIDLDCSFQVNASVVVQAKKASDGSKVEKRQDGVILYLKGQLK